MNPTPYGLTPYEPRSANSRRPTQGRRMGQTPRARQPLAAESHGVAIFALRAQSQSGHSVRHRHLLFPIWTECSAPLAAVFASRSRQGTAGTRPIPADFELRDHHPRSGLSHQRPVREIQHLGRREDAVLAHETEGPRGLVAGRAYRQLRGHAFIEPAAGRIARRNGDVRRQRTQNWRHPRRHQCRIGLRTLLPWDRSMPC